jgi:hypothetical protein
MLQGGMCAGCVCRVGYLTTLRGWSSVISHRQAPETLSVFLLCLGMDHAMS